MPPKIVLVETTDGNGEEEERAVCDENSQPENSDQKNVPPRAPIQLTDKNRILCGSPS